MFNGMSMSLCALALGALPFFVPVQKETPKFKVQVNVVSIDVEVLDDTGSPVQDLKSKDFIVKENGAPMKIVNFARLNDRPVSLAILLDTSGIELKKLDAAKQFISQTIHLLSHEDDICLYTLDPSDVHLEVDFTVNRYVMNGALENISVPSKSFGGFLRELFGRIPPTGLGIDLALRSLQHSGHSKKALLVISNRFRGLGPVTVEHVQDSGCTLLTLGFNNKAALIVTMGSNRISREQLTRDSGGRQFSADTPDIAAVCHSIVYSLKNYYSIGYQTEIKTGEEKPRHIDVQIPGRKYTINARRSYIPKEKTGTK